MTATPGCSIVSAKAALDALLAKLNVGGSPGFIKFYTGAIPATVETAASGSLLATLTLSTTAFPASATNGTSGARATSNTISNDNDATGGGVVGYFRATDSTGLAVIQGTVGTSSSDIIISNTTIAAHAVVAMSTWIVDLPSH